MGLELLLAVRRVLTAEAAVLALFELVVCARLLVGRVIAVTTLGALDEDVAFFVLHDQAGWFSAPPHRMMKRGQGIGLLDDLGYYASANSATTFTDSKAKLLIHSDRGK